MLTNAVDLMVVILTQSALTHLVHLLVNVKVDSQEMEKFALVRNYEVMVDVFG
jgi:hypothetical protein